MGKSKCEERTAYPRSCRFSELPVDLPFSETADYRYINHSCAPNCVAEVVTFERGHKIIISSSRRIQKGEEVRVWWEHGCWAWFPSHRRTVRAWFPGSWVPGTAPTWWATFCRRVSFLLTVVWSASCPSPRPSCVSASLTGCPFLRLRPLLSPPPHSQCGRVLSFKDQGWPRTGDQSLSRHHCLLSPQDPVAGAGSPRGGSAWAASAPGRACWLTQECTPPGCSHPQVFEQFHSFVISLFLQNANADLDVCFSGLTDDS